MRLAGALTVFALLCGTASAQPQDQSMFLGKALNILQQQRDEAMNRLVNAEARAALLVDEVAALKKKIAEIETPKPEPKP